MKINGQYWDDASLLTHAQRQLLQPTLANWELAFWKFVQEWLDERQEVTVHTSGSTGQPKPIRIRKEQMIHSAQATGAYLHLAAGQTALICLSCDYIAGKMMFVRAWVLGMDVIIAPPSRPWEGWKEDIHLAAMVPAQVIKMYDHAPTSLDSIQQLIIGGAAIPARLKQLIPQWSSRCYATYGMTETVTHIAIQKLNGPQATDYYTALPGVRLEQDERNCLVIHAPQVADAPVVTNDVVQLKGNTFQWLGRWDNVINSGGVKLHPEQIEAKLSPHIAGRFFIASRPHPSRGEEAILVWETATPSPKMLEQLQAQMSAVLTPYEVPKAIICVPQFQETHSGKVQREKTLSSRQ